MSITRNSFKRPAALLAAVGLLVGVGTSTVLSANTAYAAQLGSRSIQLSDSAPSGGTITTGVGSGTSVQYKVSFTTSAAMQSLVISFCSNSPLIGDSTCTAPTGMNIASATITAGAPAVTWTPTITGSSIKLASSASVTAGAVSFTINGITNPSTVGTYYARITTYIGTDFGASAIPAVAWSAPGAEGTYVDFGGIAMSSTRPITVTARVMESLLLCTSALAYSGLSCTGATTPSVTIGHGTPTSYIDTSAVDTASVYTQISTNASNGYAVYLRGSNSCGGLSKDGGTTCGIPAVNSGSATPLAITAGTAAFGMKFSAGTAHSGGTGTNTAVTRWNGSTGYMMDTATANDNITYVYGSKVIDGASQQANSVENTITLAATASATTPAGIYTENFSLVGVGTF